MSKSSLSKIPFWDGKAKGFGVSISKIEANAEFVCVGDVLDPVLIKTCPTRSEFVVLDITRPNNQQFIELYRANKKLRAIIALGQGKNHGMALPGKTKTDDYPNRLAWEFINKAKKTNKPSVASAMIKMDIELDQVQLKGVRDFYNNMVRVLD